MTGPGHYREAERLLRNGARHITEHPADMRIAEVSALVGQGFATLAAADASSLDVSAYRAALTAYRRIVATHIANVFSATTDDGEHHRARELARSLDEAGLNVDDAVDELLDANRVTDGRRGR